MPRCSFCKQNYEFPYGLTLILNDGNILYFCSSKCRKNFNLGRDNKKVNWIRKAGTNETVEAFDITHKQEPKKELKEEKTAAKTEKKA